MTENKSGGDQPAAGGRGEPTNNPPVEIRPADGGHVIAHQDQKGIIVMPSATVEIDVQGLAPSGPPAPQQAAPADAAPPPSSSSES